MLAKVQSPPDRDSTINILNNKDIEENIEIITHSDLAHDTKMPAISGGSSPSREVQEILSIKDSDCLNEFYENASDSFDELDGDNSMENTKIIEESEYNINETNCKL